jgi:phosphate transport system substrate-binding protein
VKKILALAMAVIMSVAVLAGCGSKDSNTDSNNGNTTQNDNGGDNAAAFDGDVYVVSREDGSGTRGAFVELTGVETDEGDMTTDAAEITSSTSVMMTTVAGNEYAIGYISLGVLDDSVKAVKVDGIEATAENVLDGSYTLARPFNVVTGANVSEVAQDFMNFIMSDEGQAVVTEEGYVSEGSTGAYTASGVTGSISVAGSSSVTPLMEKLKEAYIALNPDVEIEVQQSDSTTGVNSAIEGICDIGMASRELKDSELEQGITGTVIALDGIAVIVNNENPVNELTTEQIRQIYTGEITSWADVQ